MRELDPTVPHLVVAASDGLWDVTTFARVATRFNALVKGASEGEGDDDADTGGADLGAFAFQLAKDAVEALCDDNVTIAVLVVVPDSI